MLHILCPPFSSSSDDLKPMCGVVCAYVRVYVHVRVYVPVPVHQCVCVFARACARAYACVCVCERERSSPGEKTEICKDFIVLRQQVAFCLLALHILQEGCN